MPLGMSNPEPGNTVIVQIILPSSQEAEICELGLADQLTSDVIDMKFY